MKLKTTLAAVLLFGSFCVAAEQDADAHAKMIGERADKILAPLHLDDAKQAAVREVMLKHYADLSAWDDATKAQLKSLQADLAAANKSGDPAAVDKVKAQIAGVQGTKQPIHDGFVRALSKLLPFTQVNQIKDGMTYNYVATRVGIMDKLGLSDEQRTEIRDMLVATREVAMDAGTSEEKHKLFGETLGRISLRVLTPEQNDKLNVMKGKPSKTATSSPSK